jgi:tetratricopeptide (TPR) repeat protein
MSTFQILMFAATLFFAYQIYRHVQTLEDPTVIENTPSVKIPSVSDLLEEADRGYEKGEVERAKRLLEEALELDSANPEVLNKLAFITAKGGDRLKAIALYQQSLELDENDDLVHNAIASLYRAENGYERSQEHYLKAIAIDNEYAQTFYNYGNLLVDMGEIEEARGVYKRALELQTDFPEAREALLTLGTHS